MTDTPDTPEGASPTPSSAPAAAARVSQRILNQYVRDLSFENVLARKGASGEVTPEIAVQVSLDARKRGEHQYEVTTKLTATSKNKGTGDVLFVLEVEYVGAFQIEGVPEAQLHPYLLIECPRVTFPFLRRIVSDVTRDGGFPSLNLEMIDFMALYRNDLARRAQAQPAPKLDA